MKTFAKEFYDRSFSSSEFSAIVQANNSTQGVLEGAQAAYALDLFNGWPNQPYLDKRRLIGTRHAKMGITPQWYIGSYQFYFDYLYPAVRKRFGWRGSRKAEAAVAALNKLLIFD